MHSARPLILFEMDGQDSEWRDTHASFVAFDGGLRGLASLTGMGPGKLEDIGSGAYRLPIPTNEVWLFRAPDEDFRGRLR